MRNKRILALLLASLLMMGSLAGCGDTGKTSGELPEQEKQNVKEVIPETEYDLVAGGSSSYFILIPEAATENEQYAASELQYFLQEATGAKLEIVDETTADLSGSFLSVGNTKASVEAGVNPTYEEVESNGFVLKTVEDDCYIKGYSDIGTRNGVYEWLSASIDYECYAKDEIVYTTKEDLKLLAYDQTVTPSFEYRLAPGEAAFDPELTYRLRMNEYEEAYVTGRLIHNSYTFVDPTVYDYTSEQYKDWFSETMVGEKPAQLCYSNEEMREEYIKNLKKVLEDTEASVVILGMEDNPEWCTCDACAKSKETYGTDSAVMIKFANKVQEAIDVWNVENRQGKTPINCTFFAYYVTEQPPVKLDETTGEYVAIDETVKLNENLGVLIAPYTASYSVPFASENNAAVHNNIKGWAALTDNIDAYVYTILPAHTLIFKDTFEVMQSNYQTLLDAGTNVLYDQMNGGQRNGETGWSRASMYVKSKLQWDNALNMDELLDDFFANYFDVAADTMRDIFEEEREWLSYVYSDLGVSGKCQDNMLSTEYWSYPMLKKSMEQFEEAYQEIEVYRETNPERYEQLYDRITLETMQYRYLIIELFSSNYTADEALNMKYAFKQDAERLKMLVYKENTSLEQLWEAWNIQ